MIIAGSPAGYSSDSTVYRIDWFRKYEYIVTKLVVLDKYKNKIDFIVTIGDKKIEFKNLICSYSTSNNHKRVEIRWNFSLDEIYNIINRLLKLEWNSFEFDFDKPMNTSNENSQNQIVKYSELDKLNMFSLDEMVILFTLNNNVKYKCFLWDFLENKWISIYKSLYQEKDYDVFIEVFKYFLEKNSKEWLKDLWEWLYDCFLKIKPIDKLTIFQDKKAIDSFVKMVWWKYKNNILERYWADIEKSKETSEKHIVIQNNIDLEKIAVNKLKIISLQELRFYLNQLDLKNENIFNELILKIKWYVWAERFSSINKKSFTWNLYDRMDTISYLYSDVLKKYWFELYFKFVEWVWRYFLWDLVELYKVSYKDKELVEKINAIFQKDYNFYWSKYYWQTRVDNMYTVLTNQGIEYIPEVYTDLFLFVDRDFGKWEKALTMDLIKTIDRDFFDNKLTLDILLKYIVSNDINNSVFNNKDFSFYDDLFNYFRFVKTQTGKDEIGEISRILILNSKEWFDYRTQTGNIDVYFSKFLKQYNLLDYVILNVFKDIKSKWEFNIYQFFALVFLLRKNYLFKNSSSHHIIFELISDVKLDSIDETYLNTYVKLIEVEKTDIHFYLYQFTEKWKLILQMSQWNQKLIEEFIKKI